MHCGKITSVFFWLVVLGLPACAPSIEEVKLALSQKDYKLAFAKIQPLVEKNNPEALYIYSSMYHYGWGVPADQKISDMLMIQAASRDWPAAQYNLGIVYEYGQPLPKVADNLDRAATYYSKAANKKYLPAWNNLSLLSRSAQTIGPNLNPLRALQLAPNDPYAQYNQGIEYFYGGRGLPNFPLAYFHFEKAYRAGVALAAYFLGLMNLYGFGVQPNLPKAVEYWSALLNQPTVQNLGNLSRFFGNPQSEFANPHLAKTLDQWITLARPSSLQPMLTNARSLAPELTALKLIPIPETELTTLTIELRQSLLANAP